MHVFSHTPSTSTRVMSKVTVTRSRGTAFHCLTLVTFSSGSFQDEARVPRTSCQSCLHLCNLCITWWHWEKDKQREGGERDRQKGSGVKKQVEKYIRQLTMADEGKWRESARKWPLSEVTQLCEGGGWGQGGGGETQNLYPPKPKCIPHLFLAWQHRKIIYILNISHGMLHLYSSYLSDVRKWEEHIKHLSFSWGQRLFPQTLKLVSNWPLGKESSTTTTTTVSSLATCNTSPAVTSRAWGRRLAEFIYTTWPLTLKYKVRATAGDLLPCEGPQ